MANLEDQKPRSSFLYLLFAAIGLFIISSLFIVNTNYNADGSSSIILLFVSLLFLLIFGVSLILVFFWAKKDRIQQFSSTKVLIAGLSIILIILAIRYEIFIKLLSYLLFFL